MKISSIKPALLMLVCTAFIFAGLSGCLSSRGNFESPFNASQLPGISSYEQHQYQVQPDISQIKKGQTTEAEVFSLLGSPVCCLGRRTADPRRCQVQVFPRVNVAGDDAYVWFDRAGRVTYLFQSTDTPGPASGCLLGKLGGSGI